MFVKENRMFEQMLIAARERLKNHKPEDICKNANIGYNEKAGFFVLESLGQKIEIQYPNFTVTPNLDGWHQLVILHYMDLADGAALENRLISFSQLKDGMVRGGGMDRKCEAVIGSLLKEIPEEVFIDRCLSIGGKRISTNADFTVIFPLLPNFPVTLKVWFADEEFDASARMMLDACADHYLTIEDAVTVGEILLEKLLN